MRRQELPGHFAGAQTRAVINVKWVAEAIWEQVAPDLPGFTVEILPQIDSTNSELMRRARSGQLDPILLVAEHQTAGRGRLGRTWLDDGRPNAPSTLMFSLGLMLSPVSWSGLSLAVGLAVARHLHADVRLKWPNDLWLAQRKLGGILIETIAPNTAYTDGHSGSPAGGLEGAGGPGRFAVIGIGINIAPRTADGLATPPAWLAELDPLLDAATALQRVLPPLVAMVKTFEKAGFAPLQGGFNALDALMGVAVTLSDSQSGTAQGVDENGALRVETAQGVVKISSSEVSVRPQGAACLPAPPRQN